MDAGQTQQDDPARRLARRRRWFVLLAVLAAFPVLLAAAAQPFLPDTVAFHYGLDGPDDWRPKAFVFLPAGILSVLLLLVVGIGWVGEKQLITGKPGLFEVSSPMPLWVAFAVVLALDALMGWYVFSALMREQAAAADAAMGIAVRVVLGAAVVLLWALGILVLAGKVPVRANLHPGPSELERKVGADKGQQRAIGGFLLFVALIATAEAAFVLWA